MLQVTALPVNTNNLDFIVHWFTSLHLHFLTLVFLQCKTSRPTAKATGTQRTCLSDIVYKVRSQCINWRTQAGFE